MKKTRFFFALLLFTCSAVQAQQVVSDTLLTDYGAFTLESAENEMLTEQQVYSDSTTTSDGGSASYLIGQTNNFRQSNITKAETQQLSLTITPNPANSLAEVKVTGLSGSINLYLYDALGRVSLHKRIVMEDSYRSFFLDLSTLPNGIYLMQVVSAQETISTRIQKD